MAGPNVKRNLGDEFGFRWRYDQEATLFALPNW
jgi:hypothetical protein